ncbi:chemotaxis-specific protein-glutamate methyltransferase CheB [Maridesulfovibrio sp.]|uniref:chemotaxis-specific protein-glutamate methyltransferase CheB n=1 Tax=Maridesulfovibrio sp. TaxID=2795000 RepID=UPI002AA7D5ED|nr:chemotaxis-specific protein-glutamate methyltransferase CheB [Maridesulfovibrio sp.]
MIKVLIVDDSASVRMLFAELFKREDDFEVVGCAEDGYSALRMVRDLKPDVVTMDVNLPDCDGFRVTRMIMEQNPVPIVVISAVYSASDAEIGFRLIDTGALAFHNKPALKSENFEEQMQEIILSVRLMSEVKVVRRKSRYRSGTVPEPPASSSIDCLPMPSSCKGKVICIGASTGGPQAIKCVLSSLPNNFPAPILIVQHMSEGFTDGLVNWLKNNTGHDVCVAAHGDVLKSGRVYFAPEGLHMEISAGLKIVLTAGPCVNEIRPSASVLFSSAARNLGSSVVGVLLTGMGRDGADGLLEIKNSGGYTIAQDKESSIVFGMPGEAVKIGAAKSILPINNIGAHLCRIFLGLPEGSRAK